MRPIHTVMPKIKVKRFKQERPTDKQTDGRYQTYYRPCYEVDKYPEMPNSMQEMSGVCMADVEFCTLPAVISEIVKLHIRSI